MNERQALDAIRNAVRLENLAESVARPVSKELRKIFDELGRQFQAMPPGNIEREIWYRQQRLRIADMLAPLSQAAYEDMREALGDEVAEQMRYASKYLDDAREIPSNQVAVVAPQDGVGLSPAAGQGPVGQQLGNVQFTRQQLYTIAQDTQVLGERLGDLFRPSLDSNGKHGKWIEQNIGLIDRKVKTGFLTGMTNEQIAATLPGLGREAARRNKAIARTAVMDMSAKSQEALWAANSDVIKGWEFDATMDNRVCDQCAPWDGEFKEVRGRLPATPVHVNCRCRVLPLGATEMALRKEEGPQRRSVVELVSAGSKEEAMAITKAKPGVKEVRAYASQVRVKGKKYWRVAADIERKDGPLTMPEFLLQASPATQAQVLGSEKRRGKFLQLIRGTKDKAPVSPERALKIVTEWQPTVSRRPRMSMEMRLDIAKLKSQREDLMRASEQEGKHIVYGYLRAKDSGTGKAGSPYYVGIGRSGQRAFQAHTRGGTKSALHNVPVPRDERQIRMLGAYKTRAEAARREQELIARYGRKGLDDKGILLNRTLGGEGKRGATSARARQKLSEAARRFNKTNPEVQTRAVQASAESRMREAASRAKLSLDEYMRLNDNERKAMNAWLSQYRGKTGRDYLDGKATGLVGRNRKSIASAAQKYGLSISDYESLSSNDVTSMAYWLKSHPGRSASDWLKIHRGGDRKKLHAAAVSQAKLKKAASEYGVSVSFWSSLSSAARKRFKRRYAKGLRGAALLEGLL